jgi:hypothetical protein
MINMRESFEVEYRTMRPAGGAMARRAARSREFPQSLQSISRRKAGSDLPDD